MRINEMSATASEPGPPEWFTGEAWIEALGRFRRQHQPGCCA